MTGRLVLTTATAVSLEPAQVTFVTTTVQEAVRVTW